LSIGGQVVKGSIWMVGLRLTLKSIGIISTLFLARLLSPEDFGLVAIAMVFYALIELMQSFGLDFALVQNQKATKEHYDSAWTIQMAFGILSAFCIYISSETIAHFMNNVDLESLLQFLSLLFLFNGFKNIGTADFAKHFQFHKEFLLKVLPKIVSAVLTVILAFILQSYWALLFGMLINTLMMVLVSYVICDYRPNISFKKAKDIFKFSKWLLLNNVLYFANHKLQNLIVGYKSGASSTGLLSISNEFGSLVPEEIIAPINKASYPAYSKISNEQEKLSYLFLNTLSTIAIIALPLSVGLFLVSAPFVINILGDKWHAAIPLIEIIALAGALRCLITNVDYVFYAKNKGKVVTSLSLFKLIVFIPTLFILIEQYQEIGAAYAILATALLVYPITTFLILKELKIDVLAYANAIVSPLLSCCVMAVVLIFIKKYLLSGNTLLELITLTFIGGLIYITSVALIWLIRGKPNSIESKVFTRFLFESKNTSDTL